MFGNRPFQQVLGIKTEGDKTTFTWKVGQFKSCRFDLFLRFFLSYKRSTIHFRSFGSSISSEKVEAGGTAWKVVFFPKGFTVVGILVHFIIPRSHQFFLDAGP
jgi:hypothetical protein